MIPEIELENKTIDFARSSLSLFTNNSPSRIGTANPPELVYTLQIPIEGKMKDIHAIQDGDLVKLFIKVEQGSKGGR